MKTKLLIIILFSCFSGCSKQEPKEVEMMRKIATNYAQIYFRGGALCGALAKQRDPSLSGDKVEHEAKKIFVEEISSDDSYIKLP